MVIQKGVIMRTITLKTDDLFFKKVTSLAKKFHLSKSELIRRAVSEYATHIEKNELKEQIKQASLKVREDNTSIVETFSDTTMDGLKDV